MSPKIAKKFANIDKELIWTEVIPSIPSMKLNIFIIHTHKNMRKQKINPSPIYSIPFKITKNSWDFIKIFRWSLNRYNEENTQNIWNVNLIFALIFLISSNKDKIESSKQNPKIIFQSLFSESSKKKTTDVENKISGINIMPAPFGLGV